jgi:hypothetical protein
MTNRTNENRIARGVAEASGLAYNEALLKVRAAHDAVALPRRLANHDAAVAAVLAGPGERAAAPASTPDAPPAPTAVSTPPADPESSSLELLLASVGHYQRALLARSGLSTGALQRDLLERAREQVAAEDQHLARVQEETARIRHLIVRENLFGHLGAEAATAAMPFFMSEADKALPAALATFDPSTTSNTFPVHAARAVRDHVRALMRHSGMLRQPSTSA